MTEKTQREIARACVMLWPAFFICLLVLQVTTPKPEWRHNYPVIILCFLWGILATAGTLYLLFHRKK